MAGLKQKTLSEENLTSILTQLDIALSALRDAICDSGVDATTLKHVKDAIDSLETLSAEITKWGGTTLTGRDISLDLKALTDDSIKGLLKSLGDIGAGQSLIARVGEVQASPTANTILARLKDLLSGIILATGVNVIGKVGIDQTTPGTTNKIVTDPAASSPTTYNVTLTVADTQYSQAMPANCRRFEFQCRVEYEIRFAFVTGKVAAPTTPYHTLKAGDYYESGPINQGASPSTLYLASSTAGVVVEVIAWV